MAFEDEIKRQLKGFDFVVRVAHKDDARNLVDIIKQIDQENRYVIRKPGEFRKTILDIEELIEKMEVSRNSLFLVAVIDSKLVGYLKFDGKNKVRLQHKGEFTIGILRDYWGLGIGKVLINQMLIWCKKAGIVKVELKVAEENERGIKLYKKFGFKIVGKLEKDLRLEKGEFLDFILMDKIV